MLHEVDHQWQPEIVLNLFLQLCQIYGDALLNVKIYESWSIRQLFIFTFACFLLV